MSLGYAAFLVGGVYSCFLAYGVAQEKIYKFVASDGSGDRFDSIFFLVFVMCVANTILSLSMLIGQKGCQGFKKSLGELPGFAYKEIFLSSVTYCSSMLSTNFALTAVAYPTQVLIKSVKMVPVTLGGLLFFGKTYPWYDYVAVVVVTMALIVFNLAKAATKATAKQSGIGILFLFVSLGCDMVTGPRQDRLLSKVPSIGSVELMFLTNLFAVFTSGTATFLLEGTKPLMFLLQHPQTIQFVVAFAVSAAAGQVFIFSSLSHFGSLYLTFITTTRKFFTVFLSVLLFGHHISSTQWICVATIFGALTVQSYYSQLEKSAKRKLAASKKDGDRNSSVLEMRGAVTTTAGPNSPSRKSRKD